MCNRLDADAAAGRHGNCAEVLAAIARSRASPLTSQLCEPERLEGLMRRAIVPPPDTPSVQVSSHTSRVGRACAGLLTLHGSTQPAFL